jgi:NADH dehydrogenase
VKLNTTVVDYKDDIIVVMEKPFKLKFNLGSWFPPKFSKNSFREDVEKEWPNAFNKVIHTENIFAIGDTCIQLTDMEF